MFNTLLSPAHECHPMTESLHRVQRITQIILKVSLITFNVTVLKLCSRKIFCL